MRIVQGTRVIDLEPGGRDRLDNDRRVVVDAGTGDGRWPYERARQDPASLFVGLDPDAEGLKQYAFRAARKPSRGGVDNVMYVVASLEEPPQELLGLAGEVHVIYPWAALLRGLLDSDERLLRGLAAIARPGADIELILTYDAGHDRGAGVDPRTPSLSPEYLDSLGEPYSRAGIEVVGCEELTLDEALAIPSTWGRRLLHGRPRRVFRLTARKADSRT